MSNLIIHSQNITKNLMCANVITEVRDDYVLISVINISEQSINVSDFTIDQLTYEKYTEEKACYSATTEPSMEASTH